MNHLLRNAGGRRLMVMVNDFGELNIDADLLESADEDTLTLSNGCICCTMGTELLYALSDALDRRPRPDCLLIEASGVADPQKIAAAAHAEPEMRYCGVVAMADAANIAALLRDPMIGGQVAEQLRGADLILVTKTDLAPLDKALAAIREYSAAPALDAPRAEVPVDLVLDAASAAPAASGGAHHHDAVYRSWSSEGGRVERDGLLALLNAPPPGLFRFKGRIALQDGGAIEAHLVGKTFEISSIDETTTRVAAVGLASAFDSEHFARLWSEITEKAP